MDYPEDVLIQLIERHDSHEEYYKAKLKVLQDERAQQEAEATS